MPRESETNFRVHRAGMAEHTNRSTDAMFDEVRQLTAWCDLQRLLARPIDPASPLFPLLRCVLIFDSPRSRIDIHGTAVLIMPRVSTGRLPKTIATWVMEMREVRWEVIATRGADDAIERLCAMGYG